MILPDYWLRQPEMAISTATRTEFDRLFGKIKLSEMRRRIDYHISVPKWQFLCYLAEQQGIVLHGTGDPAIWVFEPRPSQDLSEFSAQTAVYAVGDGLWAMFFVILDREYSPMATSNACVRLVDENGMES